MVNNLSYTHEEADTRIILHAHEAATCFYVVVARDTDVFVLLIEFQHTLRDTDPA